jgi:hypothetical protein
MRVENRPPHHLFEELAGRPVNWGIHRVSRQCSVVSQNTPKTPRCPGPGPMEGHGELAKLYY